MAYVGLDGGGMLQTYPWDQNQETVKAQYLLDYEYPELVTVVQDWGFKTSNARALFAGLHRHGHQDFEQWDSNRLSPRLRLRLTDEGLSPSQPFQAWQSFPSQDGSCKYLFTLADGAQVESVAMPSGKQVTFCISSQVGCALGCTFCATGALGFKRHLSAGEMVAQVIHMRRSLSEPQRKGRLNVVFMGMGEPLHNLANVLKAFRIFTHPAGMVLSAKDIAVSTAGLVPRIRELAQYQQRPRLMVSIAQTQDEKRSAIMPVNRAYALEKLLNTLEAFPLKKREKIMLSYVLIAGENDSNADADRLAAMSRRFPSLINLIPMNEHAQSPGMLEPEEAGLLAFAKRLLDQGAFTTIRRSRGRDVAGACGQLALATQV